MPRATKRSTHPNEAQDIVAVLYNLLHKVDQVEATVGPVGLVQALGVEVSRPTEVDFLVALVANFICKPVFEVLGNRRVSIAEGIQSEDPSSVVLAPRWGIRTYSSLPKMS